MTRNLRYITHECAALNDPRYQMIIVRYDFAGFGKYWALAGLIGRADDCRLDLSRTRNRATYANILKMSLDEFDEFVAFLVSEECELLRQSEDGFLWSEEITADLEVAMKNREGAKARRERHKRASGDETVSSGDDREAGAGDRSGKLFADDSQTSGDESETSGDAKMKKKTFGDEYKTSGDETDSSGDESHRLDLEFKEFAAAALSPKGVKKICAKLGVALSTASYVSQAVSGKVPVGYLEYVVKRISAQRRIDNPIGLLLSVIDKPEHYHWLEDFLNPPAPPPARASPPKSCPGCGGPLGGTTLRVGCKPCGIFWDYVQETNSWEQWSREEELAT